MGQKHRERHFLIQVEDQSLKEMDQCLAEDQSQILGCSYLVEVQVQKLTSQIKLKNMWANQIPGSSTTMLFSSVFELFWFIKRPLDLILGLKTSIYETGTWGDCNLMNNSNSRPASRLEIKDRIISQNNKWKQKSSENVPVDAWSRVLTNPDLSSIFWSSLWVTLKISSILEGILRSKVTPRPILD